MDRKLLIAIISTDYPPLRTSAAVQLRDLAQELVGLGHRPIVIMPSQMSGKSWTIEEVDGVEVLRADAPPTRAVSFVRRAIAEMWLPFAMFRSIRRSPFIAEKCDLLVWYSPPIFLGPLIALLRRRSRARTYLILRDIFPEWALDIGLIRKGPVYFFFKAVAAIQYAVADVIGVQTRSNLTYLSGWARPTRRIEVLHNWLAIEPAKGCSIVLARTPLAGRKIFVYTGNLGVAQGVDILLELIGCLRDRTDLGFVFVGRGSEFARLKDEKVSRNLDNVLFFEEIAPSEIPGLLVQCHVGLVSLHPEHKTHNIPGKFVSYVQYGLPVLACVNAGTDLQRLIEDEQVGKVYVGNSVSELRQVAEQLADDDGLRYSMAQRGRALGRSMFSPKAAAAQVVGSLGSVGVADTSGGHDRPGLTSKRPLG